MDELAVLAIPAVLVIGLVLLGLGLDDRARGGRMAGDRMGDDRVRGGRVQDGQVGDGRATDVQERRWVGRFADWTTQAGVRGVRPWHVAAVCGGSGLAAGLVVLTVTRSPWLGLAFAGLAGWLPLGALRARRRRRLRELREVWPDAIDNLASGVRAGLSLPEAVAGLAERGPETLRPSFARFADDYHATGRFSSALDRLKEELADPTADRVIEALRLAREVGGSELGRMLRTLSGFLRDEQRVRKELEARQTWVVVAARMAFATPWAVLLLLATKPEAVAAYRGAGGALVLAVGAAMAVAGYRLMLAIGRLPTEERVLR